MPPRASTARNRKSEALELLDAHPLFGGLRVSELRAMLDRADLVYLAPGEILYSASEPARRVFALLSGGLQIEYPRPGESRGFVAAMVLAPALLGECQVLHGGGWSGTGVALTPVISLAFSRRAFDSLLRIPAFGRVAYYELSRRFLRAIDTWKHQQKASPEEVLMRYLLSWRQVLDRVALPTEQTLTLSQTELGRATGLARETVNRMLRRWAAKGWVTLGPGGVQDLSPAPLLERLPEKQQHLLIQTLDPALAGV